MSFQVRLSVRFYELDRYGRLSNSCFMQYADHVRWQCCRAAGITEEAFKKSGAGPVNLETTIRYHRELFLDDEIDISCTFTYGEGKTYRDNYQFRRADGTLAAEVNNVCGLLDFKARKLLPDPVAYWRALAKVPVLLGLDENPD